MTILALQAIPPNLPKWWFSLGGRARGATQRRTDAEPAPLLRAGNSSVSARTLPECKEKHFFFHASERDRRGPVGNVRLARGEEYIVEC